MSIPGLQTFLPAILFLALAYGGHHFLIGHLTQSGGAALLAAQCPPNPGPYSIRYVGLPYLDRLLCFLVAFFQSNFDNPDMLPFSGDFLASLATPIALTFIEAARSGRSTLLAFPASLGLFYQTQGAGAAFPFYWLALILSGHARMDRCTAAAKIDQAKAEAVLFAVLIGFVVPSALLSTMQDPVVTLLWQFFPAWMWLAQTGHLFFRPSSRFHTSGYWTVQATFVFTFLSSAISHFAAVWPAGNDLALLKDLYPSFATHAFLQWDAAFTFSSSLLGTLWFASNAKQVALIVLWNVIATVVVGPGAAVSGVLLWREWRLNGLPADIAEKPKAE
ncbi:hypothetical protein BGW80DRAFT_1270480 [Lactifluus volemus]|nr:hypothetical protein BGW80DRAFT_1270480 [Lactifluus volemus]